MENQYRKKEKERDFLIDSYMLLQRTVKTVFWNIFHRFLQFLICILQKNRQKDC